MYQRHFKKVTIGSNSYIIGSLSEHEVQKLIGEWHSDSPLNIVSGKKTSFTRADCYRARVIACCLYSENGKRVFSLDSDDDLIEILDWDGGVVRVLHDLIASQFLRPEATVETFLPTSNATPSAA